MPIYLMLTRLTARGRETIKERPERIKEVNKEVEEMGAKIKAQYACLGPYDFVNILEAPSEEVIMRVAVELGSRGTLETLTLTAVEIEEFIKAMRELR